MPVQFTATSLPNKSGAIKADSEGYYKQMPVGALNTYNSAGEYYVLDGAKKLFESQSILMRRINTRRLKGECGHPKFLPGMTTKQYVERMMQIWEPDVDTFFKSIYLDEEFGRKNPQLNNSALVGILADLTPSGPKSEGLRQSLERPGEDVCYSIRALTRDWYASGRNNRCIEQIFTWDHVTEPGIASAAKYNSSALEGLADVPVNRRMFEEMLDSPFMEMATEDSKELVRESLHLFDGIGKKYSRSIVEIKGAAVLNW